MPGRPISTRAEFLSLVHDTRRYACSTSGEGRTTDPVPRFSRGYFNYVCRVSACRCHCRLLSCASPFQLSGRAREISSFRYCFSTIGKRNVSQRYDIHGRKKSLRGEEEISRSLHANRLRRVAPSPSPPFLHPPSPLRDLFSSSPSSSSSFFFFSSAFNFRGCIAVFGRDPCGFLLVIFERRCARTGEGGGRKEGRSGLLLWRHGCSAGYFLSCGKRRMRRTRTKHRIVLWPSADLSSSTLLPSSPIVFARRWHTRFYASLFNSDCVFCPIRPRQPD